MMRTRLLLPLLAALALLLAVPAVAPAVELGLNMNGGAAAGTAENFDQLATTGSGWARHFVVWGGGDRTDGGYDAIVEREQAMGVKTLFVVTGVGGTRADPETYARFVGDMAARYKGKVEAYEIWNEPNGPEFWGGEPDPAAYVALLRASYRAIKAADPSATVVFGPTGGNDYLFLERAYAAGAKGYFDAMAVHTDTACLVDPPSAYYREEDRRIGRFTFMGYREVRATMLANGDDKPIWMTEFGWSTSQRVCERGSKAGTKLAGVSEERQAQYLREAFHCMQQDPYVTVAMWFNSRDLRGDGSELDAYGLKRVDGSDRPAAAAYRDAVAGRDTVTTPCADFTAPAVQVLSPTPGFRFGGRDRLLMRATSPDTDVVKVIFAAGRPDNHLSHFSNGGRPIDFSRVTPQLNWLRARNLPLGRHTIYVIFRDALGNETRQAVEVEKVRPHQLAAEPVRFGGLKLGGKGRVRVLTGSLAATGRPLTGFVRVQWQHKRGGRYRKVHGGVKSAGKPVRFAQRLRYGGRWRVRLVFPSQKPFRPATSRWVRFRVP